MFIRYFFNDGRLLHYSPLNDGFDLPSGFKSSTSKDHSLVGALSTTISPSLVNELRVQYADRDYDFPTESSQPHMEVANQFAIGVNRGNPDFYKEKRFEIVDNVTKNIGKHTLSFGGDYNGFAPTESFPLFYPFEATFLCINPGDGACSIRICRTTIPSCFSTNAFKGRRSTLKALVEEDHGIVVLQVRDCTGAVHQGHTQECGFERIDQRERFCRANPVVVSTERKCVLPDIFRNVVDNFKALLFVEVRVAPIDANSKLVGDFHVRLRASRSGSHNRDPRIALAAQLTSDDEIVVERAPTSE